MASKVEVDIAAEAQGPEVPQVHISTISVILPHGERLKLQVLPTDPIQDLRLQIVEQRAACTLTAFHLAYQGQPISDLAILADVAEVNDSLEIQVVQDEYDERSARVHVARVRDIMNLTPAAMRSESGSVFSLLSNPAVTFEGFENPATDKEELLLSDFLPAPSKPFQCLKQLSYSGWNPPPPARRLAGDFFYLDVRTVEGAVFYITAWTNGFYVNGTKQGGVFDPDPATPLLASHDLPELLSRLSAKFKEGFKHQLEVVFDPLSFDYVPPQVPAPPAWLAHQDEHRHDMARADDANARQAANEILLVARMREWAEDLRLLRNLPTTTMPERIARDRHLAGFYQDFSQICLDGAALIVDGSIPPVNPMEDKINWIYMYHNIFFTFTVDSRDQFKDFGGDTTSYRNANIELLSIKYLQRKVDPKSVAFLPTAIVDYLGQRLLCQGLTPGFLQAMAANPESPIPISYGISNEGKPIENEPEFVKAMSEIGEALKLKPHKVKDEYGGIGVAALNVDAKGIIASDKSRYIIELGHLLPRDLNYSEPEHFAYVIRPELINIYANNLIQEQVAINQEKIKEIIKDKQPLAEWFAFQLKQGEELEEGETKPAEPAVPAELESYKAEIESLLTVKPPALAFNTDVGNARATLLDDEAEIKKDTEESMKLATFLKEKAVPAFARALLLRHVSANDSAALKEAMHENGINMRYLGQIATELSKIEKVPESILVPIIREMIVRSSKHIFAEHVKTTPKYLRIQAVVSLLNAFFARNSAKPAAPSKAPARSQTLPQNRELNIPQSITHEEFWTKLKAQVKTKYGYELTSIPERIFSLPTLRAICLRFGIQLAVKDYELTKSESIFQLNDIVRLLPLIKSPEWVSEDWQSCLEYGQALMSQGRPDQAYELVQEAMAICTQVYGAVSRYSVDCYMNMARLLQRVDDVGGAAGFLEKAIVVSERVNGLDHYTTLHAYIQLASLMASADASPAVLNLAKRSLYLEQLMSGDESSGLPVYYSTLGSCFLELGRLADATTYFKKTLSLIDASPKANLHLVHGALRGLAIASMLQENYREALAYESRLYDLLKATIGEKAELTVESGLFMKQFTQSAVTQAKAIHAKKPRGTQAAKSLLTEKVEKRPATLSISEMKKKLKSLSTEPAVEMSAQAARQRVTIAQGSSWRATKAKEAPAAKTGQKKKGSK